MFPDTKKNDDVCVLFFVRRNLKLKTLKRNVAAELAAFRLRMRELETLTSKMRKKCLAHDELQRPTEFTFCFKTG